MSKPLCVLVDDEMPGLSALKFAIEEIGLLEVERAFLDPDKFLIQVDQLKSQIIFLDMEMPIYGDAVAKKLTDKNIIFVSGYVEQAIKGFEVNAIDFVPKPIRLSRLREAILKVLELSSNQGRRSIILRTSEAAKHDIQTDDILYIKTEEKDSRNKKIILKHFLDNSEHKTLTVKNKSFDELMAILPDTFVKINKSELVNSNYIEKIIDHDSIGLKFLHKIKLNLNTDYRERFFKKNPHFK